MQVFYTTIKPGGGSKGLFTHKGEEFGLVVKGRLELMLKGKPYIVEENETVYFSSEIPTDGRTRVRKTPSLSGNYSAKLLNSQKARKYRNVGSERKRE